ncbi:MAG: hypothetical protein R2865_05990 [Deinococcales bacterium]
MMLTFANYPTSQLSHYAIKSSNLIPQAIQNGLISLNLPGKTLERYLEANLLELPTFESYAWQGETLQVYFKEVPDAQLLSAQGQ